jgi:hypothetical protein
VSIYSLAPYAFVRNALAGKYSRPSAETAAALGLGDSVLIGGVGGKYLLQPISQSDLSVGMTTRNLASTL